LRTNFVDLRIEPSVKHHVSVEDNWI